MAIRKRKTGGLSRKQQWRTRINRPGDPGVVLGKRKGYTEPYVTLLTKAQDSKQLTDPFTGKYGYDTMGIIEPVYSFSSLVKLPMENNVLRQCIEAYVTNIESYGYTLEYIGKEGQEDLPRVQAEKKRLEAFLSALSPECSLRDIRERARWDKETLGGSFFEVSRNQRGEVTLFDHIPATSMRMTKRDKEATTAIVPVRDDSGSWTEREVTRHFRRFVQVGPNGKKVYFKEFGDPRSIDPADGKVNDALTIEEQATEILYREIYTPGSVYGLPRWIGQLPAVLGSRESELVNLNFFRENAIPAMAVLISGGALTEDSFERVEQYITAARGSDSMQRVMVLESAADENSGSIDHSQPAPKIDMKPMLSERQQDGLFQDYDAHNIQKVRSSFRLPPIYVGRAEDYTRASAQASTQVAESQIFSPERTSWDDMFNGHILSTYNPQFWRFKTLGPVLNDAEEVSTMIDSLGKQGALTPNTVIRLANKVLDVQIEPVLEAWGDYPFDAIMEYVKQGGKIKGMTEFIEELGNASTPTTPQNDNSADNSGDSPDAVAASVKTDLGRIKEDLEEARAGAPVQTSARKSRLRKRIKARVRQ